MSKSESPLHTLTITLPAEQANKFRAFCMLRHEPMSTVLGREIERLLLDPKFATFVTTHAVVQPPPPPSVRLDHTSINLEDRFYDPRKKVVVTVAAKEGSNFYLHEPETGRMRPRKVSFKTLVTCYEPRP